MTRKRGMRESGEENTDLERFNSKRGSNKQVQVQEKICEPFTKTVEIGHANEKYYIMKASGKADIIDQ